MRNVCAIAIVTWVFALAPSFCLGGYLTASPRASHSCPDSPEPDSGGSQNDPCRAQATKEHVAQQENRVSQVQLPWFTCPTILDDSLTAAPSQCFQEGNPLPLLLADDPFASRGLPLLL